MSIFRVIKEVPARVMVSTKHVKLSSSPVLRDWILWTIVTEASHLQNENIIILGNTDVLDT